MLSPAHHRGFTLIELLVTIALIAILLLLAVPALGTWSADARVRSTAESLQNALRLAQATKTPIIASGGLNSVKDVQTVCEKLVPEGIIGAIAGRALYEGKLDLKKAQAAADKALGKE